MYCAHPSRLHAQWSDNHLLVSDLDQSVSPALTFQVGSNNNSNDQIEVEIGDFRAMPAIFGQTNSVNNDAGDAVGGTVNASGTLFLEVDDLEEAQTSITNLDAMIGAVNNARSDIGAKQNRLEFTPSNLTNSIQNNSASMSTIRDADFAAEAADLAKNQILVQSGTAMLAQANGLSQNVLALIR